MNNNEIDFVPVGNLVATPDKPYNFLIPAYQRGYRWGKEETITLLEDLNTFRETKYITSETEIYCLQPLCVKMIAEGNPGYNPDFINYIVIDGQQRLTTINILLGFLYRKICEKGAAENLYAIRYETRKKSDEFLKMISCDDNPPSEFSENPDFWNMKNVRDIIQAWFDDKAFGEKEYEDYLAMIKKRVNFIWYEISDKEDEIAVFKRLNIGRISLTDAELVKALLLHERNFKYKDGKRELMAGEWDRIESRLQDDRFWLFFHNDEYDCPTRIDFILNLVRKNRDKNGSFENKRYATFEFFYANKERVIELWKEAVYYYQIIEEWYNDEIMYHYIGFLCAVQDEHDDLTRIMKLIELWGNEYKAEENTEEKKIENKGKDSFRRSLKDSIKAEVFRSSVTTVLKKKYGKTWKIDEQHIGDYLDFEYENKDSKRNCVHKTEARSLLLFHNVQTIIDRNECVKGEKKYALPDFERFPFHLYKKEMWDIEHIRPNNLQGFNGERKRSLRRKYAYVLSEAKVTDNDIRSMIKEYEDKYQKAYVAAGNDDDKREEQEFFLNLFDKVSGKGSIDDNAIKDDEKNKVWNYALLDASTNREYGNSCFYVKRDFIRQKAEGKKPILQVLDNGKVITDTTNETAFVPICTERVFSKRYTQYPEDMNEWTVADATEYRCDIEKKLKKLF